MSKGAQGREAAAEAAGRPPGGGARESRESRKSGAFRRADPLPWSLPLLILGGWLLSSRLGWLPAYLLPGPDRILEFLMDFATGSGQLSPYSGTLFDNLITSLGRVLTGFAIASGAGLILGFLTGRIGWARRMLEPLIHAVRTVPGIGWLPIAMVWFGVGEATTVFLIALAAFFPIYINTAHGILEVPEVLLRAGRMLGAGRGALLWTVLLPAAFPAIAVGLRLGLGVSWAYLVLGELTGVSTGLGAVMMDARMTGQTEMILVAMLCIALAGVATDRILSGACSSVYSLKRRGKGT